MPDAKKAAAPAKKAESKAKPKTERKRATPAERIAKAEADLAALREKANADTRKKGEKVDEKIQSLTEKRDKLNIEIAEAEREKAELGLSPTDEPLEVSDARADLVASATGQPKG
jgi:chromosome segregation ATPase